jgi:PAS domain S-box-containing protein
MAMVFTDAKVPGHPIIFANDAFLSLSGYDREEVLGHSFNFMMARGADPRALAQVEAAFGGTPRRRFGTSLPPQGRQHVLGRHLHQPGSG